MAPENDDKDIGRRITASDIKFQDKYVTENITVKQNILTENIRPEDEARIITADRSKALLEKLEMLKSNQAFNQVLDDNELNSIIENVQMATEYSRVSPMQISPALKINFESVKIASLKLNVLRETFVKSSPFPDAIYGRVKYSSTYNSRPITSAKVILLFSKQNTAPQKNVLNRLIIMPNDVFYAYDITDSDGKFNITTPNGAKLFDFLQISIQRGANSYTLRLSRDEVFKKKGDLGDIIVGDEFFESEGMVSKLTLISESIMDLLGRKEEEGKLEDKSGQIEVKLGEGDQTFSLNWSKSSSANFKYKVLHRLVEPSMSPPAGSDRERVDLNAPIDVTAFKQAFIKYPKGQPRMSSLGMGYVVTVGQEWKPSHFSLGTLLYSLALAPGEEQRIAVSERSETMMVTDRESVTSQQSSSYTSSQNDDLSALYNSSLDETANGRASMQSHTQGGARGSSSGLLGAIFGGGSGSSSYSDTTASQSFSQSHNQDYTSSAAQSFQQNIQRNASAAAAASRVGIRLASAQESEMVTTKIIANNNHSHALTMQYWEVLRNYEITSRVENVQLVVYIPLELIQFLPTGEDFALTPETLQGRIISPSAFIKRYARLIEYIDAVASAITPEHSVGLEILKRFCSYPKWEILSEKSSAGFSVTLEIKGSFLPFDNIKAAIRLKNGMRIYSDDITYTGLSDISKNDFHTSSELRTAISKLRMNSNTAAKATFTIPQGIIDDDFQSLEITNTISNFSYTLKPPPHLATFNNLSSLPSWLRSYLNQYEAFARPNVNLTFNELSQLGALRIASVALRGQDNQSAYVNNNSNLHLASSLQFPIYDKVKTMTFEQVQKIESMFRHVLENSVYYSQAVWAYLPPNERAMMLEKYTIGLPDTSGDIGSSIPLMNCVDNEIYGFYGNCMLMPFSYPPTLASRLDITNREVQDALYNYHTMAFRAPSFMVSLPTRGMVGEAVLGSSNASEKIDLTRFWNWQDSPITHADSIKPSDFNQDHFITKDTAAPKEIAGTTNNLTISHQGEQAKDLLAAIAQRPESMQNMSFSDLQQLASKSVETASSERTEVLKNLTSTTNSAIEAVSSIVQASMGVTPAGQNNQNNGNNNSQQGGNRGNQGNNNNTNNNTGQNGAPENTQNNNTPAGSNNNTGTGTGRGGRNNG
ncbi:MAG: hypothetical protein FWD54_06005 [Endomicrobia bacterium]|nr:hypothetical protein [Endomicrobiia bacterium]